jgi:glycosyltransferase involved in cell wall biosynthesis
MTIQISVIIPTFNRFDRLQHALVALAQQTLPRDDFEIIIVDDGSTDDTCERLQSYVDRGEVRYFKQANAGPARARNAGIRAACGDVLLFLGDDIIATPDLLAEHLLWHRNRPALGVAVLGLTKWYHGIDVSPLMNYEGAAAQFNYHLIGRPEVDPENLPFSFFYTSNVSVKRRFLLEHHLFFDEDFAYAMGEDGELAYRMQPYGMRLVYNTGALAYHEHPTTFRSMCARSFIRGQVAVLQVKKHPEWSDLSFLKSTFRRQIKRRASRLLAAAISPFLAFVDRRHWDIRRLKLEQCYDFVFGVYHHEGLLHGARLYKIAQRRNS